MAGSSSKSQVITIRLPNDVIAILEKRIYQTGHYKTISGYLRDRIIYDLTRKHSKGKR